MISFLISFLQSFMSSLTFRIRGGLRMYKDKKFPLCKWYFATWMAILRCILSGWGIASFVTMFIAAKMSTAISGWGSYIGALLGGGPVSEEDTDDLNITDFVKNTLFPAFNTFAKWCENHKGFRWIPKKMVFLTKTYKEAPRAYGFLTLSLRGGLTTFLMGLAANSVWYMPVGLLQGTVYWLGGWTCRHIYNDGKLGWKISEWYWGFVLGLFAVLLWKPLM